MQYDQAIAALILNISLVLSLGYLLNLALRLDRRRRWLGTFTVVLVFSGVAIMQIVTPVAVGGLNRVETQAICIVLAGLLRGRRAGTLVMVVSLSFSLLFELGFSQALVSPDFARLLGVSLTALILGVWLHGYQQASAPTAETLPTEVLAWRAHHFALLGLALGLSNLLWLGISPPATPHELALLSLANLAVLSALTPLAGLVIQRELTFHLERINSDEHRGELEYLLEYLPIPVMIADQRRERVVYANLLFSRAYQQEPGGLVGWSINDLIESPQYHLHGIDSLRQRRTLHNHEVMMRVRGELRCLLLSVYPLRYRHTDCLLITYLDITPQKQTESALQHSRALYMALARNYPNGIVAIYDHDLRLSLVEGRVFESAGLSRDALVGRRLRDVAEPGELEYYESILRTALAGNHTTAFVERRGRRYEIQAIPIHTEDSRQVSAGLLISRDTTEMHESQTHLRHTQKYYRDLFQLANDAILIVDTETCLIHDANNAACQLYGYTPSELIGMDFAHLLHDPIQGKAYLRQLIDAPTTTSQANHARHVTRGGAILEIVFNTSLIDYEGKPALLIISHDITTMIENERRYRLLAEHTHDLVMLHHVREGVSYISPSSRRLIGYAPDELTTEVCAQLYHPADTARVYETVVLPLYKGETPQPVEYRMRHRDGHYIWLETRTMPIHDPATGALTHYVTTSRDVSQRVAEAEKRRETEHLYRSLAQHVPDGAVVIFDHDLRYLLVDGPAVYKVNLTPADITGKTTYDLIRPPFRDFIIPLYYQTLQGEAVSVTLMFAGRYYETYFIPLFEDDNPATGAVRQGMMFSFDVSARRAAELDAREFARERERIQIIADFVRDASHEFRSALTIIQANSQLAQMNDPDERLARYLNRILNGTASMLELIDSLETMTQLDSGAPFCLATGNVNLIVNAACDQLNDHLRHASLSRRLILDLHPTPLYARVDNEYLRRAILCLLDNAARHTDDESGIIIVSTRCDADRIRIDVRDNGTGIPAASLPHIFERFYRVDKARTTRGFGLGLSIARRIVQAHGGQITVESTPGDGSCFTISLPAG